MILRVTNSGGATASVTATAVLEGQSREPDWAGRPPTDYFVVNPGVTTIPPGGQADFIVGGTAELATYGFEPTVNAVVTLVPSEGAIDGGQQVITFIMGGAAAAASSFGDEVADGNGPYAC